MSVPRVSVAIAVRNGEHTIDEALRSVLDQTFADFEVIAVDDGSTDRTADIVERVAARDSRVRFVRHEHRGLAASLNQAIALSAGEYVARQDADDVSMPQRFEQQVRYLDAHPAVCAVGTAATVIDDAGRPLGPYPTRRDVAGVREGIRTFRATPVHGSMMFRRRLVVELGGYRGAFEASQDSDLWLRLSERCGIDNLAEPFYRWRLAAGSVYTDRRELQLRYSGIARMFAIERARYGDDSYDSLASSGRDLGAFAASYRLRAPLHALWGELLLRGGCHRRAAFREFHSAVTQGDRRPRTLIGWAWTALRLPWPGGKPLRVAVDVQRESDQVL